MTTITTVQTRHPSTAGAPRRAGAVQAGVLVACNLMPVMGVIALAPVMPLLLQQFAATPNATVLVPIALTVPAVCIALLSGFFGTLADRFGRHRLMIVALLCYTAFGVMPLWLDSLLPIVASRVGIGIAEAMIITLVTTLTGDYFAGDRRKKWIGWSAAVASVMASVLFGVAGALGQISWRGPFAMYFLGVPIAALVAWLLWEPVPDHDAGPPHKAQASRHPGADAKQAFPWRAMLWVYGFSVPVAMLFFVGPIHLGRVMNEIGVLEPSRIGMATGIAHIGVPVGALLFHRLARGPLWRVLALAVAFVSLPLIGLRLCTAFGQVMALMLISQFGCGLLLPSMMGWCLSHLPFAWRGRGSGLFNSAFFFGQFITALVFAMLVNATGSVLTSMLSFGLLGVVLVIAVLSIRMQWGTADGAGPGADAAPAAPPLRGAAT